LVTKGVLLEELTQELVEAWIKTAPEEFHYTKTLDGLVEPQGYAHLRKIISRCVQKRLIKPIDRRGNYRVVKHIEPVKWWDADESEYFDLNFPWGHEDDTYFGFADYVKLSPGDLVIISGVSNTGKSALALNILAENVDKYPCVLMGNEYTTLDGEPSPKFKRRMLNMKWVQWHNGVNPKFDLLPVRSDFEDYVRPGYLNIIDWINITDQFYKIGKVLEDIKTGIGKGLAVVVLQKEEEATLGRGKGFTRDLADLYLTIDPFGDWESRLTVGKVKDSKSAVTGKM
jgi:hypothetical protein